MVHSRTPVQGGPATRGRGGSSTSGVVEAGTQSGFVSKYAGRAVVGRPSEPTPASPSGVGFRNLARLSGMGVNPSMPCRTFLRADDERRGGVKKRRAHNVTWCRLLLPGLVHQSA